MGKTLSNPSKARTAGLRLLGERQVMAGSRGLQFSMKAVAGQLGVRQTAAMRGPSMPAASGHCRTFPTELAERET